MHQGIPIMAIGHSSSEGKWRGMEEIVAMERDARKMRKGQPFVFTNLMSLEGLDSVTGWIKKYALLEEEEEPMLWR